MTEVGFSGRIPALQFDRMWIQVTNLVTHK